MAAPRFPEDVLAANDWQHRHDETETALELPFFTITAFNAVFEHAPSAPIYDDIGDPDVDVSGRSAFTSALQFSTPLGSFGVRPRSVFSIACEHAKTAFADSVREDGLVNVSRLADRELDRIADDAPVRAFGYRVQYPLRDTVVEESVSAGQFTLAGELWAGIWPTDTAYAMAGGMFPTETVREAVSRQAPDATPATGARQDASIEVAVADDRETVLDAIRRVETDD